MSIALPVPADSGWWPQLYKSDSEIVKFLVAAFVKGCISDNLYSILSRIPNPVKGIRVVTTIADEDTNRAVYIQL